MNETIRLLLADDQEMVRAGFRMVLDAQQEMTVVGEVGDGRDAVDAVLGAEADQRPDLVLMDIRMPRLNGVVATEAITAATSTKVLVLTTFDLDEYVYSALQASCSRTPARLSSWRRSAPSPPVKRLSPPARPAVC